MIDLRSDTVTKPSKEMLEAMMSAQIGDDVYGEDPSVNELQNYICELTGKESAIFMPSGTQTNQVALKINTDPGDEIICEENAHIFYYETAAPAIISNVQINHVPSEKGLPKYEDIEKRIRPDIYYFPNSKLFCLENTHNRYGGRILDINETDSLILKLKSKHPQLRYHLDGARLWNSAAATGYSIKDYCKPFDTISLCLSKGLGAPIGSVLVGEQGYIQKAWKWRKILGGGMRQAGILAKGALFAIEHNFHKMKTDHENAKEFSVIINQSEYISCDLETVETNMAAFKCVNGLDAENLRLKLIDREVLVHNFGNNVIRTVFHIDLSKQQSIDAANIILDCVKEIM